VDLPELRILLESSKTRGWVTLSTELFEEMLTAIEAQEKPDYAAAIVNWPMPSA